MFYRFLKEGEVIESADEYLFGSMWRPTYSVGGTVSQRDATRQRYRRPIAESTAPGAER